jgi:hypothetical protein
MHFRWNVQHELSGSGMHAQHSDILGMASHF